jgi:tRNA pseudouridine55 synthase
MKSCIIRLGDNLDGILLVDKPVGLTSADVVSKIKKRLKLDKVGHTGTLDPFASGLLVLCIGKATKLALAIQNDNKTYEGTILFGNHYDTLDTTGKIVETKDVMISEEELVSNMKKMIGSYLQVPPMYSAIKKEGRRLYTIARKGVEVEREGREVQIYDFRLIEPFKDSHAVFFAHVSKGTYIRSLAVDLAYELDTLAALQTLRRLSVGKFKVSDAKLIEAITLNDILPIEYITDEYQTLILNDYMISLVKNGVVLDTRQITTNDCFVVLDQKGNKIALYGPYKPNRYKPILFF